MMVEHMQTRDLVAGNGSSEGTDGIGLEENEIKEIASGVANAYELRSGA